AGRGAARRERERKRGRRRAAAAAGLAVVAVTGGTFYLTTGPDGDPDPADVTTAAAPDTAAGTSISPDGADPATTSSSPTASPSARPSSHPPKPSPSRTTTKPAPPRTTAPAPRPQPTRPTSTSGSGGGTSDPNATEAQQVIDLTNAERAKAGCGPVTANSLLTRAAQGHSDDMAARNFFDHTNPDGADPGDRVTATGYRWSTYGENIAKGQRTPAEVMDAWMNSPGHRANILNCSFKEIGIGIHDAGGPYWTQVFGAQ
ncbi:CAP domain-containing protein, partial [Streptomyces sp. SKN60]|uniref:CAP domain-containing protein n=1 Tax=Streptomyces sp. SKN60 TaxID=2855506 RepID=UPI002246C2CA